MNPHHPISFGSEDRWHKESMMWRKRFLQDSIHQSQQIDENFMALPSGSFAGGSYLGQVFVDEPKEPPYHQDTPENHLKRIIDETQ